MSTTMNTTRDEREALDAAQAARAEAVLAAGRRLADGVEPDALALLPEELRACHAERKRIHRLREALVARRELPALVAAETEARAACDAKRTEMLALLRETEAKMAMLSRPVLDAAEAASAATRRAAEAATLLGPADRDLVLALEKRAASARARAGVLRRQADEAPGLLARIGERIATLARDFAATRQGFDDVGSYRDGLTRAQREAEVERARLAALSPASLLAEAEALDGDAQGAEGALAALWSRVEAEAAPVPIAPATPATSPRAKRGR